MSKETSSSSGVGLAGAVFVLFLGLKLGGIDPVSSWSWWWVFSPLLVVKVAEVCWSTFMLVFIEYIKYVKSIR